LGSYRSLWTRGLRLVSAEEIVQSPVEEISNHIVEFLNAVEFEWKHFARNQRIAGEYDGAMFSDVLAKMLFYQDQAEDDFTRRNSLLAANSAPFLILVAEIASSFGSPIQFPRFL
jgi:hypothetical protein